MGGGEGRCRKKYDKYIRAGGQYIDSLRYLHRFDKSYECKKKTFTYSAKWYYNKLFSKLLKNKINILKHCKNFIYTTTYNPDTSPGPSYINLGFRKKYQCLLLAYSNIKKINHQLKLSDSEFITYYWKLGGRAKLRKLDDALKRAKDNKPNGRAIWIPDIEESLMSSIFVNAINTILPGDPEKSPIMIGFDKFKQKKNLTNYLKKYDFFVDADYTQFDSTIPPHVIELSFDILRMCFRMGKLEKQWFKILRRNFIYCHINVGNGTIVVKEGGIPSGSGFTSIIGSIVNAVLFFESLKPEYVNMYEEGSLGYVNYGDDTLIGIKKNLCSVGRFCNLLKRSVKRNFGVRIDDIKYHKNLTLPIVSPIYEGSDFSGGTSHLKVKGYKRLSYEPGEHNYEGQTHRWSYRFSETWSFLKMSLTPSHNLIKNVFEVFSRFYHPENRIINWNDYIMRLKMIMIENMGNKHILNRCYHYLYDAYWFMKNNTPFNLVKHSQVVYRDRRCDDCNKGERMWYRRRFGYVNFDSELCMSEFNSIFNSIVAKINKILGEHECSIDIFWKFKKIKGKPFLWDSINYSSSSAKIYKILYQLGLRALEKKKINLLEWLIYGDERKNRLVKQYINETMNNPVKIRESRLTTKMLDAISYIRMANSIVRSEQRFSKQATLMCHSELLKYSIYEKMWYKNVARNIQYKFYYGYEPIAEELCQSWEDYFLDNKNKERAKKEFRQMKKEIHANIKFIDKRKKITSYAEIQLSKKKHRKKQYRKRVKFKRFGGNKKKKYKEKEEKKYRKKDEKKQKISGEDEELAELAPILYKEMIEDERRYAQAYLGFIGGK
jgi:hypothetical protein